MKILIFDDTVFGHHLEYLHHLCMRAVELPHKHFIFAVPKEFQNVSDKMEWPLSENIEFVFFEASLAKTPFSRSRLLGKFVKKHNADEVLLISLMSFLPWIPLFVPAKVKVSGIIYLIYLYRWAKSGWRTRILDVLKYLLFVKCHVFHRIFLLNDATSPRYLNRKFKTTKFEWLPDPVAILTKEVQVPDLRKEWNLDESIRVFSHFGALSKRKGTLEILKAIIESDSDVLSNSLFVFAGRVGADIRHEFYQLLEIAREHGASIKIFDKFCGYPFLLGVSKVSSLILMPYTNTEQSSGVIAYAALSGNPVAAPWGGLLGKLVDRYNLGITLADVSMRGILRVIREENLKPRNTTAYLEDNSLEMFNETIFPI